MRGRVLQFSDIDAKGTISGDDGVRYTFTRRDLQGGVRDVAAGVDVDFTVNDGLATSVFVITPATPVEGKSKMVAGLLALFFGCLGIHKFYLNRSGAGVVTLLCGTLGWILFIPGFVISIICFIEAIIYFCKSDAQFHEDYVVNKKSWF